MRNWNRFRIREVQPLAFRPVRSCDNVLRLLAELDLEAIRCANCGVLVPEQFEECLRGHNRLRERYLRFRRSALRWEAASYGLIRTEFTPDREPLRRVQLNDAYAVGGIGCQQHDATVLFSKNASRFEFAQLATDVIDIRSR